MSLLLVLEINGWIIAGIIIFILYIIFNSFTAIQEYKNKLSQYETKEAATKNEHEGKIREKDLMIESIRNQMTAIQNDFNLKSNEKGQQLAALQFEKWKTDELNKYIKIIEDSGKETAAALTRKWIMENEERIRKDAANRSVRNVLGKVTEHLIPFSDAFSEFNPKDARFLGTPIDLVVFDGIEEKENEITIYFIEVKTGTSALSQRQKRVMEAVRDKRVEWRRISIKDFGEDVNDLLASPPA